MKVVIGIGTNIGDRLQNIKDAITALNFVPTTKIINTSFVYETAPWGYEQQEDFLNCAVVAETELSPQAILGACLGIEAGFGRMRYIKNGPRILDLDILFYESATIDTKELMLPHPGISDRPFVLYPLKDMFPNLRIFNYDLSEDFKKCDNNAVSFFAEI